MRLIPVTETDSTDFTQGALLLVDKPAGWTSFDVVNKIRRTLQNKYKLKKLKVGHSGTLDPMATGLLLICTGSWTKKLGELTGMDKSYIAEITLGVETDTYDAEGSVTRQSTIPALTPIEVMQHLQSFRGNILQVPPAYSAIKKDGKRLYELARKGETVIPEPRRVTVMDMQLLSMDREKITLMIHCGSGFYVRSLAHDLGAALGCGAHLSGLIRNAIGPYALSAAFSLDEWIRKLAPPSGTITSSSPDEEQSL